MEITIQENANNILNSINSGILSAITNAFKNCHPQLRMKQVKITNPSFIVAIGKNAQSQTHEVLELYKEKIVGYRVHQISGYTSNITLSKSINSELSHPLPNSKTFDFTTETIEILKQLDETIEIHFLISGGGSSAFSIPEDGFSTDNYLEIIRLAMIAGYNIEELNLIRSLIDKVKGGKTAKILAGRTLCAWITSDVVSDNPKLVASGPLNPGVGVDPAIINWLNRLFMSLDIDVEIKELIEKLDLDSSLSAVSTIVTSRMDLISPLQSNLESCGYQVVLADVSLSSTIEMVCNQMEQLLNQFYKFPNRIMIYAGEPTISLTTQALEDGKGGRNSALSCLMADILGKNEKFNHVTFVSVASDGKDGSSPLSGYVINNKTKNRLAEFGDINEIIRQGNSGLALQAIESGIIIKQTDINLLDIFLIIIE